MSGVSYQHIREKWNGSGDKIRKKYLKQRLLITAV